MGFQRRPTRPIRRGGVEGLARLRNGGESIGSWEFSIKGKFVGFLRIGGGDETTSSVMVGSSRSRGCDCDCDCDRDREPDRVRPGTTAAGCRAVTMRFGDGPSSSGGDLLCCCTCGCACACSCRCRCCTGNDVDASFGSAADAAKAADNEFVNGKFACEAVGATGNPQGSPGDFD